MDRKEIIMLPVVVSSSIYYDLLYAYLMCIADENNIVYAKQQNFEVISKTLGISETALEAWMNEFCISKMFWQDLDTLDCEMRRYDPKITISLPTDLLWKLIKTKRKNILNVYIYLRLKYIEADKPFDIRWVDVSRYSGASTKTVKTHMAKLQELGLIEYAGTHITWVEKS